MDTILSIPCRDAGDPAAAVVQIFEDVCDLVDGLLFLKGCDNAFSMMFRIAPKPQYIVDFLLGKRKSRDWRYNLCCFVNNSDLFLFRGEQA